jgi:hypothetical protein
MGSNRLVANMYENSQWYDPIFAIQKTRKQFIIFVMPFGCQLMSTVM